MIGKGDASYFSNLHVNGLNMIGPDHSGGLIGTLTNSSLFNSSVQGTIYQTFGTDGGGGLIGHIQNADVFGASSNVNLLMLDNTAYGVSDIGGVIGSCAYSRIRNVYALGNIDYSHVTQPNPVQVPHRVGGFMELFIIGCLFCR